MMLLKWRTRPFTGWPQAWQCSPSKGTPQFWHVGLGGAAALVFVI